MIYYLSYKRILTKCYSYLIQFHDNHSHRLFDFMAVILIECMNGRWRSRAWRLNDGVWDVWTCWGSIQNNPIISIKLEVIDNGNIFLNKLKPFKLTKHHFARLRKIKHNQMKEEVYNHWRFWFLLAIRKFMKMTLKLQAKALNNVFTKKDETTIRCLSFTYNMMVLSFKTYTKICLIRSNTLNS